MARVHTVKKARKNYKDEGIKKGEPYYWWQFRFGGKHRSKTYPKPQQLTQSDFMVSIYDIQDNLSSLSTDMSIEDLESERDSIVEAIHDLASEQEDKLSNMPDSLQGAPTGELLQSRADSCEEWASNLESIDISIDDDLKSKEKKEALEFIIDELQECQYDGE